MPRGSVANLGAYALEGPDNPAYDAENINIVGLHGWIRRHKTRTGTCQKCGAKPPRRNGRNGSTRAGTEFANISGEYRRDVDDYIELCNSCHQKMDGTGRKCAMKRWHP